MKKIFLGSVALATFSISVILFQISCQKSAEAQSGGGSSSYVLPPATTTKLGGVMPDGTTITVDANGRISAVTNSQPINLLLYSVTDFNNNDAVEIWTSKLDGTNKTKIPITIPTGFYLNNDAKLTPDGQNVTFSMYSSASPRISHIYTCKLNGTGLTKIVDGSTTPNKVFTVNGAY